MCYKYMKTAHEAHRHSTACLPLPPEGGGQHFAMDYHCAAAASSSRLREYTQIKTRIDEQSVRTKELERNNAKKVKVVSYCILVNSSNREKKIEFNVNFFSKKCILSCAFRLLEA